MNRWNRAALLLVGAIVSTLLVSVGPGAVPTARAGESGAAVQGNYVPLASPARVLTKTFADNAGRVSFTALGVQGIPRVGTTALEFIVSVNNNNTGNASISLFSKCNANGWCAGFEAVQTGGTSLGYVSSSLTMPVDSAKTTNQVTLDSHSYKAVTVTVDVAGYYTTNAVGGGFVATRQTTVLDTRVAPEVIVPAGGTLVRTLTGGIVPRGATAAHLLVAASSITANGAVVAVPTGTDPATAKPVMTFWNGAGTRSDRVVVKLPADGRVTFKNTSAKPVHLIVRATGYITASPATGADYQVINSSFGNGPVDLGANQKTEFQIAGGFLNPVPASGIAAVPVHIQAYGATHSGYLKISPSGQAGPASGTVNYNASAVLNRHSGLTIAPGTGGKITIENVSAGPITVELQYQGWFLAPTGYATAGGDPRLVVAQTASGPCYAYLNPASSNVTAGCAEDYAHGGLEVAWVDLAPVGETFRGPISIVARPGGRFAVMAVHAPDGEVWTWEMPHALGLTTPTPIRSFRYVKTPVVTGTLPDGKAVGFTSDVQGRFWAIDLHLNGPEQPPWRPLDIPVSAVAPVGELTTATTSNGVRLTGVNAAGEVVTALYPGAAATSLDWQSIGGTGVTGRVALGVSGAGVVHAAVRHGDGTVWSARLGATGATVDGWHPVDLTHEGTTVVPEGSPGIVFDPGTQLMNIVVRGTIGRGTAYRAPESTTDSGQFVGGLRDVYVTTAGISTDPSLFDFRSESPLTRRWAFPYRDSAGGLNLWVQPAV